MRGATLLLTLLATVAPAVAGVYTWKDGAGRVHFGDRPPAGTPADEVKIRTFTGPVEVENLSSPGAATVTLLTTAWCGVCRRAKSWLATKGIAYTELDVEKSENGKAEYRRLNGSGVPIILVGNQRMNGFSAERLEQMLKSAGR